MAEYPPPNKSGPHFVEIVTVLVGKDEVAFTIHIEVFKERAAFWRAAFSEHWTREGKAIRIPSEAPNVFGQYLGCVYLGKATVNAETNDQALLDLIALHSFASRLYDWKAADICIDQIEDILREQPGSLTKDFIESCYSDSHESSPLRRLCVDICMHEADPEDYVSSKETFPDEFNRDLAIALMRLLGECRKDDRKKFSVLFEANKAGRNEAAHFHLSDEDINSTYYKK